MAIKHIVTRGYGLGGTRYIPTRGYLGETVSINRPGCVHAMDAAVWNVKCRDTTVNSVTGTDAAVWNVTGSDESC